MCNYSINPHIGSHIRRLINRQQEKKDAVFRSMSARLKKNITLYSSISFISSSLLFPYCTSFPISLVIRCQFQIFQITYQISQKLDLNTLIWNLKDRKSEQAHIPPPLPNYLTMLTILNGREWQGFISNYDEIINSTNPMQLKSSNNIDILHMFS